MDDEPRRKKKRRDIDDDDDDRPRKRSRRDEEDEDADDIEDDDRPRKRKRPRDDDEEREDDRPRKRGKKKKSRGNKGLKIGLIAGGCVLAVSLVIVLIFVLGRGSVDPDIVGDWGPFHFSRGGTLTSREHPGESLRYSIPSPGKLRIENGALFGENGVIVMDYSISADKQSLTLRPNPNRSITFGRTKITVN
jgi:hypothetical protein